MAELNPSSKLALSENAFDGRGAGRAASDCRLSGLRGSKKKKKKRNLSALMCFMEKSGLDRSC